MTLERSQLYDEAVFASQYVEKARKLVQEAETAGAMTGSVRRPGFEPGQVVEPGASPAIPGPVRRPGPTLVAAGNVCLAGEMRDYVSQHGSDWPLREVSQLFRAADVTLVNLQCLVARGGMPAGEPSPRPFCYRADPDLLDVLRVAGIRTVATANEQAMDYGPEALREQGTWLVQSGIGSCGSGPSLLDAATPCYCAAGGTVVAIIGIDTQATQAAATATTAGINHAQGRQRILQRLAVSIAEARNRADLIVVTPHWDAGGQEHPTPERRHLAHSIIDLGADAVLGHSTHILHGVEVYAGCPIVYDMGSLLFDRVGDGRMRLSAVFALPFGRDGFGQLRVHPIVRESGRARRAESKEFDEICELLRRWSDPLGTTDWDRDGESMSISLGPRRCRDRRRAVAPPVRDAAGPALVRRPTVPPDAVLDSRPSGAPPPVHEEIVCMDSRVPDVPDPFQGRLLDVDSKPNCPSEEATRSPAELRACFVDQLARQGYIKNSHVLAAFRAVPRHLFLPSIPPLEAYRDVAITTALRDGVAASSSSRPSFMAVMIDQLDARSGQRVLEIGAGTAYNAAVLSQVVGATGSVVSVDIDPEIVLAAQANLQRAGYAADGPPQSGAKNPSELTWFRKEGVSPIGLVCRDGCLGDADRAPFDRLMVTGGSWDIVPAWRNQLVEGGRLMIPLMLFPEVTLCVAFEKRQDALIGRWMFPCKFIAMRGLCAPPNINWASYEIIATPQDGPAPGTASAIIDRQNIHLAVRPRPAG